MYKLQWIVCILLIFVEGISGQIRDTFFISCDEELYLSYEDELGPRALIVVGRENTCTDTMEVVMDVVTFNVCDATTIFTEKVMRQHWCGMRRFLPDSVVILGYAEYFNDSLLFSGRSSPADFAFRFSSAFPGRYRVRFQTQLDTFKVLVRGNPDYNTDIKLRLHCTNFFAPKPDTIYQTYYLCRKPEKQTEYIYTDSCSTVYKIDSVQLSRNSTLVDTIRVEPNEWVKIFGQDVVPSQWERFDSMYYDKDSCLILLITVVDLYNHDYYIPNAFTPNFDGVNDLFTIHTGKDSELIELLIFDRWGELIFRGKNWDGRFQDRDMHVGVYTYMAKILHRNKIVSVAGDVTLIR